jgi:DNA-binding SARP family transcriptional activator
MSGVGIGPSAQPGELLRAYRLAAGLTQDQVANSSGLSVRAVRDLESGVTRRPRRRSIERIADILALGDEQRLELIRSYTAGTVSAPTVAILGPLTVTPEEVHTPMLRSLLGVLALHTPGWVGRATVVDALWGDAPPRSTSNLLNVYIGQLRNRLGVVHRVGDRYRLDLTPDRLDVGQFTARVSAGERARVEDRPVEAFHTLGTALDCWRGPVLADLHERLSGHPRAVALAGRRVEVALAYGQLAVALGRHGEAAVRLQQVCDAEPLHEALGALLIRLLSGGGDQVAALRRYFLLRDRLTAELGVGPGEALHAAYAQALGPAVPDPTPDRPVPAQLPAPAAGFTGRRAELDWLAVGGTNTRVIAIVGPAGSGKTALALEWGRRLVDRTRDGQLYVNLRGYDRGEPMTVAEVLGRLLRGLGVHPGQIPVDPDEAAALYRSLVAGRQLLIVLDNALNAAQVRPLLPGGDGGARSPVVLLTSRNRLTGLVALDGARSLRLTGLPPDEAGELLTRFLGPARTGGLDALVRACGGLPLALRIAAAALLDDPDRDVTRYAARLRSAPLDVLQLCGDEQGGVRAAITCSYLRLSGPARAAMRLLGCVPSGRFDRNLASHLAVGDAHLDELTNAHLLDESEPGRYAFHDLVREYAAERLAIEDPDVTRAVTVRRLVDWYVAAAVATSAVLYPQRRLAEPRIRYRPVALPFDGTRDGALAFLEREGGQLAAVLRLAVSEGYGDLAELLAITGGTAAGPAATTAAAAAASGACSVAGKTWTAVDTLGFPVAGTWSEPVAADASGADRRSMSLPRHNRPAPADRA